MLGAEGDFDDEDDVQVDLVSLPKPEASTPQQVQAASPTAAFAPDVPPVEPSQANPPGTASEYSAASGHGESPSGSVASPEPKGLTIVGHLPIVVGDPRNILPQDGLVRKSRATLQSCTLVIYTPKARRPLLQLKGASTAIEQLMLNNVRQCSFTPGDSRMVDSLPPALLSCVDLQLHDELGRAVYRRTKTTSVNHDLQPLQAVRAVFSLVYFSETLDGKALVIQDDVTKREEGCAPLSRGRMSDHAFVANLTHALGGAPQPGVVYLLPSLHHLPISSDVGHLRLRLRVHVPSMGAYAAFPSDITVVKKLTPDLFTARAATGKEVPCTTTNLALARTDPNVPFVLPAIPPSAAAAAGPAPADVADMSRLMHVLQNMAAASQTSPPLGGRRRPREEGGQPSDMSCASEAKAARRE